MINLLSNRYAKALYDLSSERGNVDSTHRDLIKISQLIRDSEGFKKFLRNPAIASFEKEEILEEIFQDKVTPMTYNFLLFLKSKNRLDLFEAICAAFDDLYDKANKILKVRITSSITLTKHQIDSLCQHLKKKFQMEITPRCTIDPQVVGGFKVQVGDRVYDYSLQTQLEKFKEKLIFA